VIPLIAAGAALLGSALTYHGQREANATNQNIADRANDLNFAEAQRNRDFQAQQVSAQNEFQERMANTVHQREVEDLKKAGINPILTVGSGAPAPSGSAASGSQATANTTTVQNTLAGAGTMINNALSAAQLVGGIQKQAAETKLINTQAKVMRKDIPKSEIINEGYDLIKPLIRKLKEGIQSSSKQYDSYKNEVQNLTQQAQKTFNLGGLR